MKRVSGLFKRLISYENLILAFRKAYSGCSKAREPLKFNFHLEKEIIKLRDELNNKRYQPGGYRVFRIYDPKERTISVAPFRDRVVHHAVVNVLEPVYEKVFIYDSYATRKDKGTHRAILRVQEFLRRNEYYLRTDIEKYFESTDHEVLLQILKRKIKDGDLLWLLERIIKAVPSERGLPIGNLTSQFLANVYLDPVDHYLKDHLRVKYYVRYMDDMAILANDMEYLKEVLQCMKGFIEERLRLKLKERAVYFNRRPNGVSFTGARIFPNHLRIKRESLVRGLGRLRERQRNYVDGKLDDERFVASVSSIIGHMEFFNSYSLRQSCGQALWN